MQRSRYIPKLAPVPTSGSCRKQSPISIATHPRWLGIRRGTAFMARPIELLAARSMAQNGMALAKRHDRSGGKLSRILSAMHALEAFVCMRETIPDSRGANSPRQASIPGLRANNASRKVAAVLRQEEIPRTVASSPQLLRAMRGEDSGSISLGIGHTPVRWKLARTDPCSDARGVPNSHFTGESVLVPLERMPLSRGLNGRPRQKSRNFQGFAAGFRRRRMVARSRDPASGCRPSPENA